MNRFASIEGNKNFKENIGELTSEQQKAFNNLKQAFKKCLDLKIMFYNNYGTLGAVDKAKINKFDDELSDDAIYQGDLNTNTFRLPCNEWADDDHYFHPTK